MLPENHRCESVLAEKADPTWFPDGERTVTLGEDTDDQTAGEIDQAGNDTAGSTQEDRNEIDSDDGDDNRELNQETEDTRTLEHGDDVENDTVTSTQPANTARSQRETQNVSTVEAATQSRLSVPDSIRRLGMRVYHLISDLLRVGSILAVWIGAGLVGWNLLMDVAVMALLKAGGVVGVGLVGLYVTTR